MASIDYMRVGSGPVNTPIPTKQSNVDDFTADIFEKFEVTHKLLAELEAKLGKVLLDDPGLAKCTATDPEPTELYRILRDVKDRADSVNSRISDLVSRVRL